jgi:hypothetical protein
MPQAAGQNGIAHSRYTLRPRRWYTTEVAPPSRRAIKLTARQWRYRSLTRRKHNVTATYYRSALSRRPKKKWRQR